MCAAGWRPAGRRWHDATRGPTSPATWCPRFQSRLEFLEKWAWATSRSTGARPFSAVGPAHSPGGAAGQQPGACATCSMRPPSACTLRQTRFCSTPCKAGRQRATRWWWWSDEDTIRRADHIIDIGPNAGKRGGAWWQGQRGRCAGHRGLANRPLPAARHAPPLQARRAVAAIRLVAASAHPANAAGQKMQNRAATSLHWLPGATCTTCRRWMWPCR